MALSNDKQSSDTAGRPGKSSKAAANSLQSKVDDGRRLLDSLAGQEIDKIEKIKIAADELVSDAERELLNELAMLTQASPSITTTLTRDGSFKLHEADDGWTLNLTIEPALGDGERVTAPQIIHALRDRKISKGVDLKAITGAVASHTEGRMVSNLPVVKGVPATKSDPGAVELFCGEQTDDQPKSYAGLDQIPADASKRSCKSGAVIARVRQPVIGESGYNALGVVKPAVQFPPIDLVAGDGVRVEGDTFIAEIDGTLEIEGQTLHVHRILFINRDVFGHEDKIDFDGAVHIKGNVRDKASITATGDITTLATVGVATIVSKEGSVFLNQGIAGANEGLVTAAKDIEARFAENATLRAGGSIRLEVGAINARMTATESIEVEQGRGQVIGGMLLAGNRISARIFGNNNETRTVLMAGYSPEQLGRLADIEFRLDQTKSQLDEIAESLSRIKRFAGEVTKLNTAQQEVYAKLLQIMIVKRREINHLNDERHAFKEEACATEGCEIVASTLFNPGCEIVLGQASLEVNEPTRSCRAVWDDQKVIFKPR